MKMNYTRQERANIAKTFYYRMIKLEHNQTSFAPVCGVQQAALSMYCTGRKIPSMPTFIKIEHKLQELGV